MTTRSLGQRPSRALAFPGDGLLDIFLGLTLLDAWTILLDPPGAEPGGLIIILFPLLLVAKGAITVPRLPLEPPHSAAKGPGGLLALVFVAVVLVPLGVGALWLPLHGRPGSRVWEIVVLAGIACVAVAGARIGARRFVAYAGLTGVALVPALHGRTEVGAHLVPVLATGMGAGGGVLLARFLKIRPRSA